MYPRHRWILIIILTAMLLPYASTVAQDNQLTPKLERIRQIVLSRGDDPGAVAYLVQLSRDLSPADATSLYLELAHDYLRLAKYNEAGELLRQMVNQFPEEETAQEAARTLVRLYSSREVAHTQQAHRTHEQGNAGFATFALHLAGQTRATLSPLAKDPELMFLSAVAGRNSGRDSHTQGMLTTLKHQASAQLWQRRARAEDWLTSDREEEAPLPVQHCVSVTERPQLDGILQEPCWATLRTPQPQATQVGFAYDEEFLYVAMECQKIAGVEYLPDNRPRDYDADLSKQDRIRLRLDLDRDYSTWFEMSLDHRGWTAERCWLAKSWNPRWFVAAQSEGPTWTAEAAIPLSELGIRNTTAGEAWVVSLGRFAPTLPEPAGEFELLLFD